MDLTNQLKDAEAAYAMIVKRAAEWGVDTARLGMIGFSAGAGLTMHATLNSKDYGLDFIGPDLWWHGPGRSAEECSANVQCDRQR